MPKKNPKLPRGISMRNGSYRVRICYLGKQYDVGQFESLTVAKAALEQVRIDIVRREFVPPAERRRQIKERLAAEQAANVTVRDAVETWLDALKSDVLRPRSPGTLTSYRSAMNVHVLPHIGDKKLTDVTEKDIDNLVTRAAGAGPSAARNTARYLRTFFNYCASNRVGGLTVSPVKVKIDRTRSRSDDEVLTKEEMEERAERMPEGLQLAVRLAFWQALRAGEVLGLQRADFVHLSDPDKAVLRVRRQWNSKAHPPDFTAPKDDSVGDVALPEFLLPEIREHLKDRVLEADDAPVFPSPNDSARPLSHNSLRAAWLAANKGLKPYAFHALRHGGLTEYNRQGATPTETARRGRHKDFAASARYQHASAERDRALVDKLNAAVKGGKADDAS